VRHSERDRDPDSQACRSADWHLHTAADAGVFIADVEINAKQIMKRNFNGVILPPSAASLDNGIRSLGRIDNEKGCPTDAA
jgi:hypothetical protein